MHSITARLDTPNVKIVSNYFVLKEKFNESVNAEKKKYPLSDRETLFVNTMNELLDILDGGRSR